MSLIRIEDLETSNAMDCDAMVAVYGGAGPVGSVGVGQGIGGRMVSNYLTQDASGINLFSPQIAVQTAVDASLNLNMATLIAPVTEINTNTIVASVLGAI